MSTNKLICDEETEVISHSKIDIYFGDQLEHISLSSTHPMEGMAFIL